jgi:hypothetical protein
MVRWSLSQSHNVAKGAKPLLVLASGVTRFNISVSATRLAFALLCAMRQRSDQLGMIDFTNIDPLLSDLADIPPLLPPAVLPPLKVRKDHTSTSTNKFLTLGLPSMLPSSSDLYSF